MKKLLLGLGILSTIVTPVAATVSCGDKTEDIKEFTYESSKNKHDLETFLSNNKGHKVKINVKGIIYEFTSTGVIPIQLKDLNGDETPIDSSHNSLTKTSNTAVDKRLLEEKERLEAQAKAEQEAKIAREIAAETKKLDDEFNSISAIDIEQELKSHLSNPISDSYAEYYYLPPSFNILKDVISYRVEITKTDGDDNTGIITYDAKVMDMGRIKELKDLKLTGFKVSLDQHHKIMNIQKNLDAITDIDLSSSGKASSSFGEYTIGNQLRSFIKNDYGLYQSISNIKKESGKLTFDVSYGLGSETASKTISFINLLTDQEEANNLQEEANKMEADVANYLGSNAGRSDDRFKCKSWIDQNDNKLIGAGKLDLTSDLLEKMGFCIFGTARNNDLISEGASSKFEIDPKTMKVKFYVSYNGISSTIAPIGRLVYSQQMRNFDIRSEKSNTYGFDLSDKHLESLPTGFEFPIGISELKRGTLAHYIIPASFKIPAEIKTIDIFAFAGAKIESGFMLPDTITKIETAAFESATIPGSLSWPSNIDTIGENVFKNATIGNDFKIPDTVKKISEEAFSSATIGQNFELPKNLEELGKHAFVYSTIGDGFKFSEHIKLIKADEGKLSDHYTYFNGPFDYAKIPSHIDISKLTIDSINGKDPSLDKQDKLDKLFDNIQTTDKKIPNYNSCLNLFTLGMQEYDNFDFSLTIPSTVRTIGEKLFVNQIIPAGFKLPESVIHIGLQAFDSAKFEGDFKLPSHLETIGADAFTGNFMNRGETFCDGFIIPDSVISIGEGAFANRTFGTGFTIGKGVTELEGLTFYKSIFKDDFVLPDTIVRLIDEPFKDAVLPAGYKGSGLHTQITSGISDFDHKSTLFR